MAKGKGGNNDLQKTLQGKLKIEVRKLKCTIDVIVFYMECLLGGCPDNSN